MTKRLQNKTAIITGAGSGIGRGIALAFVSEGAKIVVADWSEAGGKETVEQIIKQKGEAVFIKTDVSKTKEIDKMVTTCLDKYGGVDILVNNAGIVKSAPFEQTTEEDWDKILNVNLKSIFLSSKRVIPEMLKSGQGKIINITSIAGLVGFGQIAAYSASKGGIIALTRELAIEYAPNKINVNCIAPGVIKTAMTKDMLEDPATTQMLKNSTPYPRFGEPADIAMAAVYLASSESDFVTGEVLVIDGGWTAK